MGGKDTADPKPKQGQGRNRRRTNRKTQEGLSRSTGDGSQTMGSGSIPQWGARNQVSLLRSMTLLWVFLFDDRTERRPELTFDLGTEKCGRILDRDAPTPRREEKRRLSSLPGKRRASSRGSAGSAAQGSPEACDRPEPGVEAPPAPSHSDRARDHAAADRREGGCLHSVQLCVPLGSSRTAQSARPDQRLLLDPSQPDLCSS